eukprot:128464-Amphidinium_carterae.1
MPFIHTVSIVNFWERTKRDKLAVRLCSEPKRKSAHRVRNSLSARSPGEGTGCRGGPSQVKVALLDRFPSQPKPSSKATNHFKAASMETTHP